MKAYIQIELDNAAFEVKGGHELARILRDAAFNVDHQPIDSLNDRTLRDLNGNTVGSMKFED